MHNIIPGILEIEWEEIEKKLSIIRQFSKFVHIDFLDGKFSKDISFLESTPFEKYSQDFFMEAHLMVEDPTSYIKPFAKAGFKRFLGHIEKMTELDEFVAEGQIFGEIGLALDVDTSIDKIKIDFNDLDCILLMGVKAGKSGQEFVPSVLTKIQEVRKLTQIPIEIDGGIKETTLTASKRNGADRFVATSFIFENKDPMQAFEKLSSIS